MNEEEPKRKTKTIPSLPTEVTGADERRIPKTTEKDNLISSVNESVHQIPNLADHKQEEDRSLEQNEPNLTPHKTPVTAKEQRREHQKNSSESEEEIKAMKQEVEQQQGLPRAPEKTVTPSTFADNIASEKSTQSSSLCKPQKEEFSNPDMNSLTALIAPANLKDSSATHQVPRSQPMGTSTGASRERPPSSSSDLPQTAIPPTRSQVSTFVSASAPASASASVSVVPTPQEFAVRGVTPKGSSTSFRPSNTIIASDGNIYGVEPFMLPPPQEIASLFSELRSLRERGYSIFSDFSGQPERRERGISDLGVSDGGIDRSRGYSNLMDVGADKADGEFGRDRSLSNPPRSFHRVDGTPVSVDRSHLRRRNVGGETGFGVGMGTGGTGRGGGGGGGGGMSRGVDEGNISSAGEGSRMAREMWRMQRPPPLPLDLVGAYRSEGSSKLTDGSPSASMNLSSSKSEKGADSSSRRATESFRDDPEYFNHATLNVRSYIFSELLGLCEPASVEQKAVDSIENFLAVPIHLESFISFGWVVCLDAFLYVLTFLPIRFIFALFLLSKRGIERITAKRYFEKVSLMQIHRTHVYDLMRGVLLVAGFSTLSFLNMSRVYHYVRQQNTVKLYVLTGMLEIFDKLLCSFGQDAFDSLYWQTRNLPTWRNMAPSFTLVMAYVCIHSCLYFMLVATLTVAINSSDQSMIAVLVLNNYAEIKSFVFKKFDKQNLFQLSCADITERFNLTLFMATIFFVGVVQAGEMWREVVYTFFTTIIIMVFCEASADWIKHAFITKFNGIDSGVYDDYARILRKDVLSSQKDLIIQDRTFNIARRMGLSQIPLTCCFLRYMWLVFSTPAMGMAMDSIDSKKWVLVSLVALVVLFSIKVVLGISILSFSGYLSNKDLERLYSRRRHPSSRNKLLSERQANIAKLSNILRYTVHKGRVVG